MALCLGVSQRWLIVSISPRSGQSLISHADAKVRTLALGALFVHEDPQDLPLIASLVDDKISRTFPAWAAAAAELTSQEDPAAAKAIIGPSQISPGVQRTRTESPTSYDP